MMKIPEPEELSIMIDARITALKSEAFNSDDLMDWIALGRAFEATCNIMFPASKQLQQLISRYRMPDDVPTYTAVGVSRDGISATEQTPIANFVANLAKRRVEVVEELKPLQKTGLTPGQKARKKKLEAELKAIDAAHHKATRRGITEST